MTRKTKKADDLDRHIGSRIRTLRENAGMTQGELAGRAHVSYQQIHKYEKGANRISAGRLGMVAEVLGVPVQAFYDGYVESMPDDVLSEASNDNRLCMEMAKHFRQIPNPRYQEALHLLIRILAQETEACVNAR